MQSVLETFFSPARVSRTEMLPKGGSERSYHRAWVGDTTYLVCENKNIRENETFFYFTQFFRARGMALPEILFISPDRTMYIQEDLGRSTLLDKLLDEGYTPALKELYRQSVRALVQMQWDGGRELDFTKCFPYTQFDAPALLADLNYFKYYFLDLHQQSYDKQQLQKEFLLIAQQVAEAEPKAFMYRDFQGRNIMVHQQQPYFLDYQGGMLGPVQYDMASLLWQAKAALPDEWRDELYQAFKTSWKEYIVLNEEDFDRGYAVMVLARLLQVLGAYGLRGKIEKRPHFLKSIPLGLHNLQQWQQQYSLPEYPELMRVIRQLTEEVLPQYTSPVSPANTHPESVLHVHINSFSFKQGMPADESGHGGGFVMDCRCLPNPGRQDAFKTLTGRDSAVIAYLENLPEVISFLQQVKGLADIAVQDYLQRGFAHLSISFGCTGGQHRSVYCADQLAHYIQSQYPVQIDLHHVVQEAKNWTNQ